MIPTELIIALSAFTGFITGLYVQGWIDAKDWGESKRPKRRKDEDSYSYLARCFNKEYSPQRPTERDEHGTLEAAMADLPDYLRRQAE